MKRLTYMLLVVFVWIVAAIIMRKYGMSVSDVAAIICLVEIPAFVSALCNSFGGKEWSGSL